MPKYSCYRYSSFNVFYFQLIISLFIFSYICLPNIYSQTLTAEQVYEKVKDAVVVIHAYNSSDELIKQGSGVIIKDKGYVITNYHVLAGCERIEISHNKKSIPFVDIIGIDVNKDILILKIEKIKAPTLKIRNLNSLLVGQKVYAIGSPLGFENTMSEGIISGIRNYDEMGRNFIQITASISPGSSGGAVVNDKGELIGISTLSTKEGQNLNFVIPIDDVMSVDIHSYSENKVYKDYELLYKGSDALEKDDYNNAIKYFTSFIDKYPNNEIAYWGRGCAKGNLKNTNGAIQDFTEAIEINPNFAEAYYSRGHVWGAFLEKYRNAIRDYDKAIEINPKYAAAYCGRSIAKRLLENYIGALQDINKAIEINPYFAVYYKIRGLNKLALKDKYGACLDFSRAGELGDYQAYECIKMFCE
jgi:Tfp pilus assembly protein PilF